MKIQDIRNAGAIFSSRPAVSKRRNLQVVAAQGLIPAAVTVNWIPSTLVSALQSVTITRVHEDFFAQRPPRTQRNNRKEGSQLILPPRPLRLCAHMFLPAGSWLRHILRGRGRLIWEQDVLNREQSITGHCPSLRFLCCLLFESCVRLRLAALCSLAAIPDAFLKMNGRAIADGKAGPCSSPSVSPALIVCAWSGIASRTRPGCQE
jgi:hypothetical protein